MPNHHPHIRLVKLIEYVFIRWFCPPELKAAEQVRNEKLSDFRGGLPSICFDKLCNIIVDLWDSCYHVTRHHQDFAKSDHFVKQPMPVITLRGLHGPGKATRNDTKIRYMLDIIEGFQLITAHRRFEINNVPKTWPGSLSAYPALTIQPADKIADIDVLLRHDFDELEQQVAREIATLVAMLSSEEIRSLGTHHKAESTFEDLLFELEILQKGVTYILEGKDPPPQFTSAAYEVWRKAVCNRAHFEKGRDKAITLLAQPILVKAFQDFYHDAPAIWDHPHIAPFTSKAKSLVGLSNLAAANKAQKSDFVNECIEHVGKNYGPGMKGKKAAMELLDVCRNLSVQI